ncbi:Arc family DNA-binding protein [Szabonella alba]|uniref:Arc family DNA-binding protein n=1 Tax=Szabonella alba TaxID=2804194 RepID=A0A8K0Y2B6_9RHOB|nr:Arc family DNA-binding protein [Szabonella alba]MBL4919308.1 Arc family DNA-binding protein [Szabonella alba]
MTRSKREELGQIVIRPPEGMRERIKAAAEANNRSMNAEIVATLEEKYPATTLEEIWRELQRRRLKQLLDEHTISFFNLSKSETDKERQVWESALEGVRKEFDELTCLGATEENVLYLTKISDLTSNSNPSDLALMRIESTILGERLEKNKEAEGNPLPDDISHIKFTQRIRK